MDDLIVAFGLFLLIEGILYALFPSKIINMSKLIQNISINNLRIIGFVFAAIGFIVIWYIKS